MDLWLKDITKLVKDIEKKKIRKPRSIKKTPQCFEILTKIY